MRIVTTAVAVLAVAATAALAAAPKVGTYTGTTAQATSVKVKVSKKGTQATAGARFTATCGDGTSITDSAKGPSAIKKGRFKVVGGGSQGQQGVEIDKAYVIAGHFTSSKTVKGTVDADYQKFDANGNKTGECKTGKLAFTATR